MIILNCYNKSILLQLSLIKVFRLAVYGGQSASSTLYFFQEDFLPSVKLTQLLINCEGNVNCQDNLTQDTPLHFRFV